MKKLILSSVLILSLFSTVFAQENIVDVKNTEILNQELRKTSRRLMALEGGISLSGSLITGILPISKGGLGVALTDPNADRILFWDDSEGEYDYLGLGSNLSITGTTLNTANDVNTGNLIFSFGMGNEYNVSNPMIGIYKGTSLTPSSGHEYIFYMIKNSNPEDYHTIASSKWTKIAGVNTVTVHAWIWQNDSSNGYYAKCKVNIGSANGEVNGSSNRVIPEYKSFTVDVSGLTNGTTYELTVQLMTSFSGASTNFAYLSHIIGIGS